MTQRGSTPQQLSTPQTEPWGGPHLWPRPQGPINNLSDTERVPKVAGNSDDSTPLLPTPRNLGVDCLTIYT